MSETNYDIFIAYKDKNDNSDRTWSSIIGEQIYTSLKNKGYSPFTRMKQWRAWRVEEYLPLLITHLRLRER